MEGSLKCVTALDRAYSARIAALSAAKGRGKKIVGTLCLYVPDEIIFAAGADRVILCGGRDDTIPAAEAYLPRGICPLAKASFGAIASRSRPGAGACPHVSLVDLVVAEATCDAKKKMYELLGDHAPTYVLDLPQKPDSPEAVAYFRGELEKFRAALEGLTGIEATDRRLRSEIRRSNDTRRLFQRLYDLRRRDPPPIRGTDVLKILQKQFILSPRALQAILRKAIAGAEAAAPQEKRRPRLLIAGCPMPGGNTKVPDIVEARGGAIVAEESCTGTRSFEGLVDEAKDPMAALAERYIRIPCACMTPNDRRIERIVGLVEDFRVDGVVYYTLQACHGYNVERYRVQQALRRAGVPMLAVETDFGASDAEQIGIRVDAFLEMLG